MLREVFHAAHIRVTSFYSKLLNHKRIIESLGTIDDEQKAHMIKQRFMR